jgi:hypothetical protein
MVERAPDDVLRIGGKDDEEDGQEDRALPR